MTTRVGVAYLHPGEVDAHFHNSLLRMVLHHLGSDVVLGSHLAMQAGSGGIAAARNEVVRNFLATDDEWLFWVDSDMGFEPDIIERLLRSADRQTRPIVGALAFGYAAIDGTASGLGDPQYQLFPTIMQTTGVGTIQPVANYPRDRVVECDATGSACILIHRRVFERMAEQFDPAAPWYFRMLHQGLELGEDVTFCLRAKACGYPIFVDPRVKTSHRKPVFLTEELFDLHRALQPQADMVWVVPTRGRPDNAVELRRWHAATSSGRSRLLFVVDSDDPELEAYQATGVPLRVVDNDRRGMTGPLNQVAVELAESYRYIGFMGDDHRPRSERFDQVLAEACGDFGLAYGDDLLQGENLPTAVVMTSNIVRALGYMVPPAQDHLYLDDFWLTLGRELDSITYRPDVVLEHVHPAAGKAASDEGYEAVNSEAMYDHDRAAFEAYKRHQLHDDVVKLKALR